MESMHKLNIGERFIPDSVADLWIPKNTDEAVKRFMVNDSWNGFTVPMFRNNKFVIRYKFLDESDQHKRYVKFVRKAHASIEYNTCLYFWDLEHVTPPEGTPYIAYGVGVQFCDSELGRENREMKVYVGKCPGFYAVIHEIMHILGFYHEFQRPDRDSFVSVDYKYIPTEFHKNFDKKTRFKWDLPWQDPKYAYDYFSIMHYRYDGGSRIKGKTTLWPLCNVIYWKIGGFYFSERDNNKLQFYYGCHRFQFLIYAFKAYKQFFYYDKTNSFGYKNER